ncbi:amidohydrolase family protein [Microtetraspora sp. AC03309]|uniref:amidohydrolase family protein n=1 Tax=Microtetraspora sp. AC03309 TaxID=2779376 RepID=UPI001E3316A9|nr:amidohydrolase family protein [Microtetraspora sp. AC03309]MCC5576811.1 amidohydrolase family protein [Microtetraspora sp. AC03309]
MSIDVHQHLWTPSFLDALRRRSAPPRLDGWTLLLDGEPPYEVDPDDHDLAVRASRAAGLDLALVSLSSPLGIEHLPPDEAWPLIDAYHAGAAELPAPFRAWAAAPVTDIDPVRLSHTLDQGFAGLQLPATALRDAAGFTAAAPLLDVLAERGLPLFVHPGPAAVPSGSPAWWAAVVPYAQQMHASWYAFQAVGRPRHPDLKICFALLAGLAPLHSERATNRGAPGRGRVDPGAFVETSSYGSRAIDAVIRELGIDVVVNGSDQPYAEAPSLDFGDAARHAIGHANAVRLLQARSHHKPSPPPEPSPSPSRTTSQQLRTSQPYTETQSYSETQPHTTTRAHPHTPSRKEPQS